MKIPHKLARKLARMAAAAGMSLREFVNRGLVLAAKEKDHGIDAMISGSYIMEMKAMRAKDVDWIVYVDAWHGPMENQ